MAIRSRKNYNPTIIALHPLRSIFVFGPSRKIPQENQSLLRRALQRVPFLGFRRALLLHLNKIRHYAVACWDNDSIIITLRSGCHLKTDNPQSCNNKRYIEYSYTIHARISLRDKRMKHLKGIKSPMRVVPESYDQVMQRMKACENNSIPLDLFTSNHDSYPNRERFWNNSAAADELHLY